MYHECSQAVHSILGVLLRQAANRLYYCLLCLGAMLVPSSYVGKFCNIRRRQTIDALISRYQFLESDSTLNRQL